MRPSLGVLLVLALASAWAMRAAAAAAVPFSGIYGGTAGAGATLGWDRFATGGNPATLSSAPGTQRSTSLSLAGYSPFGLEGLRVLELGAARDGARWSGAATYQGSYDGDRPLFAVAEAQASRRGKTWSAGLSGASRWGGARPGFAGGLGGLWRPVPWGGLGGAAHLESGESPRLGLGADVGSGLPGGPAWRLGAEALSAGDGDLKALGDLHDLEFRYGLLLRLHALLSVQGGWAQRRRSAALGVRFGAGAWEGFSAVRRHAMLGGTAVQGLRWRTAREGENIREEKR